MTDWREELIEQMAKAAWPSDAAVIWDACPILLKQRHLNNARAALAVAEPVIRKQVEFELRVKNVCVHGTSHPEIYKTAEDDLREELAAAQSRIAELTKIATTLNVRTSKLNVLREENARLREALEGWQKWWALPWQDRRPDMADVCWKRSRIAIMEEKSERLGAEPPTKGCRVCGLQYVDETGRLVAMGYSCRRDDCPSRVIC